MTLFTANTFPQSQADIEHFRSQRAGTGHNEFSPMSQIPETIGTAPFPGVELPAQNAMTDLMFIRSLFPYLPILPLPSRTVSVKCMAGVAQEIAVPDGATIARIIGSDDYYISQHGNAELPVNLPNPSANIGNVFSHSMFKPEFSFFYVGGVKALSAISVADNTIVQVLFWSAENWPRR
jgi:hypothetical protein